MAQPIVLVSGASGNLGQSLCKALRGRFYTIGLDINDAPCADESFHCDFTTPSSIELALHRIKEQHGDRIAAVIHLAAYFDFTGEPNSLYQTLNVDGTRHFLSQLQRFAVERFIYASTMLVHEATVPGHKINESSPVQPGWAYPESKAQAEEAVHQAHGSIPFSILRLAGLYDDHSAVPTLSYQIARIYERDIKSVLYRPTFGANRRRKLCDIFGKITFKAIHS